MSETLKHEGTETELKGSKTLLYSRETADFPLTASWAIVKIKTWFK